MKVLIVTIAIGKEYIRQYETYFKESQGAYAKKHGYDFKIVTDFLEEDLSKKHRSAISFQKILVGCHNENDYDLVVFLDADILINVEKAPPIHLIDCGNKIGIVDEYTQPSFNERIAIQIRMGWERTPSDYYLLGSPDFSLETESLLNTGVLLINPKKNSHILKDIYTKYIQKCYNHHRGFHFEQSAIGYELQKSGNWYCIDNKWNSIWSLHKMSRKKAWTLQEFYDSNYFIHFAGGVDISMIPFIKK